MRRLLLAALLLALGGGGALATTIVGADYNNQPLTPANGDVLSGTFINVSSFNVMAGVTVFVQPNTTFAVYATTVAVYGVVDGTGRGFGGGGGGTPSAQTGVAGFAPSSTSGAGTGGSVDNGGGGGARYGNGGIGAKGGSGGVPVGTGSGAGSAYGTAITSPISVDDAMQGSGGGGGGANASLNGGNGGAGGAAIYLEASSVTVTGSILVDGSTATAVTDGNAGTHPGGGGGGSGGTLVIRGTGGVSLSGSARLSAKGGGGASIDTALGGTLEPGGGGGGGAVLLYAASPAYSSVVVSTAAGVAGSKDSGFSGSVDATNPPTSGAIGYSTFGVVSAQPTGFTAQGVYVTSISYVWNALTPAQFGDAPTAGVYHVYPSTDTAPFGAPDATTSVAASTITSLTPNTTYFRFVTGYTDWGDSLPSNSVSTHTLANAPGAAAAAFSAMGDVTATVSWTANAPANPTYTSYEVDRSTDSNFGLAVSTSFVVGLSSAPTGLLPNTTYFFRVRAVNLDGVPSAYAATLATATLATAPTAPAFGTVFVTSTSFVWSGGANPVGTVYQAQVSTDNFFSIAATSQTLATSATFFSMTPGTQYYFRAFAINVDQVASAFSAVVSTKSGNLNDLTSPTAPGTPQADRQFSYDGTATFSWAASQSSVGILDYHFIIGSTPGGNDIVDVTTGVPVYQATGLATGRSYYARVSGRSNAGVTSPFSAISAGLPVFIAVQANPLERAINWPNPFNPATGPTQIGFVLYAAADVDLKIYTLQGRLVHTQSYSFGAAGNQIVSWDGRNDSGGKVAPGGYVCLIQKHYSGHTDSQKLKIAVLY